MSPNEAIQYSVDHYCILHLEWTPQLQTELNKLGEEWVYTKDDDKVKIEYWGTSQGSTWRIHLIKETRKQ